MAAATLISDIKTLINAGEFQDALKKLTRIVKDNPDDAVGHSYLGMAQEGAGNLKEAAAALRQAYHLDAKFGHLQNLAVFMTRQGQAADALAVLKQAPKPVTSHNGFAGLYMSCAERAGALSDAINYGMSLVEADPANVEKRSEVARLMVAARDYQAAVTHLEILTAQEGGSAPLFANLGMVLSRLDRDEDAAAAFSRAVQLEPENPLHLTTLAKHQRKLRQFEHAEVTLIRALALDPASAECHSTLGSLFLLRGRFLEAADCFREMTRQAPDQAKAHQQLGQALQRLKRYDSAVEALETALELDPQHAPSHNSMGVLLKKIGRLDASTQSYLSAIKADPEMKEAYNNLANVQRDNNAFEAAKETIKQALARWPAYGELYNSRGVIEQQSGEKDKAVASYLRAIELNPDLSKAFHNLTAARKIMAGDPMVLVLAKRAVDPALSQMDRINYNFALGKAMGDLKFYPESYAALERGNQMRKAELGYDIARDQMLFENIKSFFSGSGLAAVPAQLVKGAKRPIFILGMSRSGTSLTEQIVSAHPDVYGCGELEFLNQALKKMPWLDQSVERVDYDGLCHQYLESIAGIGFEETVFTDKMPLNFRWVGWILKAFPNAKIVHMVRDPMAVCWSNYQRLFAAEGMAFTFDQEDMGKYYAMYLDLMAFWREVFPGRIFDFVYEDLTENQEAQSRRLCAYLDLSWDGRMLSFQDNKRPVKTASSAQVREKIYQGSSEEWRKFEAMLGPMKEKLNIRS